MTFKAAGAPCDLARENILLNSGSYSTTAQATSDDYRFNAITSGTPARLAHVPDATAYSTQPLDDNWLARCRFGWSPANLKGNGQAGSLT
jgi:hypothetical protein